MNGLPLWTELREPALDPVWAAVRRRLSATGLQPTGRVEIVLDDVSADLLGGLLGLALRPGRRRIALADLDVALRRSPVASSLVDVLTVLGGELRNRPAERSADADRRREVAGIWQTLVENAGLPAGPWTTRWTAGLRADGLLGPMSLDSFPVAVTALALVLGDPAPRTLGQLAAGVAGDAHALDPGRRAGTIALRGLAALRDEPPPATADERIRLWQQAGVRTDDVSGTVLTLGWWPPGTSRWAGMMRERAELGLVTHLTLRELRAAGGPWAVPGTTVHACENPQVLQAAADGGAQRPLICLQGNPSVAGTLLVEGLLGDDAHVRYHGDLDWPGLAIAGRVLARGAQPWRLTAEDYVESLPAGAGVPLTGAAAETPWDPALRSAMVEHGRAVHEEAVLGRLLDDLT